MIRLVQLDGRRGRRLAVVQDGILRLLEGCASVYDLAQTCIATGRPLGTEIGARLSGETADYDEVCAGSSEWGILPSADHPYEPARCLISGTGLTHMASAKNRQAMHAKEEELTDSMRIYRWGIEGGKPRVGSIGCAPEWFHKGDGSILKAHNEPLEVPPYAEDGGEEPEIAAVYLIDPAGAARRIGFTVGNEFSDHEFERRNYLYLAASKLRTCSIGPELVIGADFSSVSGEVSIERNGTIIWRSQIRSGESWMSHSLENLEHHHFKFAAHRRPGDVHIHFLGADAFSFGEGIRLQHGDVMQVRFEGFGRALRNALKRNTARSELVRAQPLPV